MLVLRYRNIATHVEGLSCAKYFLKNIQHEINPRPGFGVGYLARMTSLIVKLK